MRYFVVQLRDDGEELAPGEIVQVTDVRLIPCEDADAVHEAIVDVQKEHGDWRVFEMCAGRAVERAVKFNKIEIV